MSLADKVAELEERFDEVCEDLKMADIKVDELEGQLENLTEEHEALKKYVAYIESVYPEMDDAYAVANRLEG